MSEPVIWNELGNVYLKIGEIDGAISAYLKAIELNPRYGWPYSNMAYAHVQKGNYTEAIPLYKKSLDLLETDKDRAISWNRLGDTYRLLMEYKKAFEAYQAADRMSVEPVKPIETEEVPALFPDAILFDDKPSRPVAGYVAQGSPRNATSLDATLPGTLKVFVQESQGLPDWLVSLPDDNGWSVGSQNNAGKAAPGSGDNEGSGIKERNVSGWLRELLKGDARKEAQSLDSSSSSARKNDLNNSSAVITEQCNHFPERSYDFPASASAPARSASSYPAAGDASPVVIEVEKPVRRSLFTVDPTYESPLDVDRESLPKEKPVSNTQNPSIPILSEPRPTQPLTPVMAEIRKYEKIISMNETNDRAWDTLGKLYKSLGRYDDAVRAFEKAIALSPHHEAYHYNLGLVFTVQNRYLDAIEHFQNAITLNNDYILAHGALAGCYRRLGKNDEAAQHIEHAMPMMADESEYNRACFNAICGNNDQAIEMLRVALMKQDVSLEWVQSDPDLESIRQDPRFTMLLKEIHNDSVSV